MLLHIGAFRLDVDSDRRSLWHRLTPQTRVLCALGFVVAAAFTPVGHWWTWGIYGLAAIGLIVISRVTIGVLLKRAAIEFVFIGLVLLGTLFHGQGDVLWQWGWLRVTTGGLTMLGSVMARAALSLVFLNILVLTTSVPDLLQALACLKLPPLLVAILASMYRYLDVLVAEFHTMRRAALARNLMSQNRWQRLVLGNTIGVLFIRSLERGERIHQAMLARGYSGIPQTHHSPHNTTCDFLAITIAIVIILIGQLVYL